MNMHKGILGNIAAALASPIGVAPISKLDLTSELKLCLSRSQSTVFATGNRAVTLVAILWSPVEMLRWIGGNEATR
jgi:isocitrate/isopropylmalate dehydrogenase